MTLLLPTLIEHHSAEANMVAVVALVLPATHQSYGGKLAAAGIEE